MSHVDFSSWPREQEATFAVYEETTAVSQKKAWTIAIVTSVAFFVAAIGIYAGVAPSSHDIAKDMNMSNLTKKAKDGKAPAAESK